MRLRHFSRKTLPATAWKNGGGTTQAIACWPEDASLEDFGWRVSIATIAAAGPFSVFPGVDRSIMLLDGAGVHLRSDDGDIDHRLDTPHRPFGFRGDAAMGCTLLGGASSDLNVMVRRSHWRAEIDVIESPAAIAPAPHGVLLSLKGHWRIGADASMSRAFRASRVCGEGEGLNWCDAAELGDVAPTSPDARLVVVRFVAIHAAPRTSRT